MDEFLSMIEPPVVIMLMFKRPVPVSGCRKPFDTHDWRWVRHEVVGYKDRTYTLRVEELPRIFDKIEYTEIKIVDKKFRDLKSIKLVSDFEVPFEVKVSFDEILERLKVYESISR